MEKKRIWITTEDNPYDPFTQWNHWCDYDGNRMGYNTVGEVAKRALYSDDLTPAENEWRGEKALLELVDHGIAMGRNGRVSKYVLAVEGNTTAY